MGTVWLDRPVDQRPAAVDSTRKQGGIFVLRRRDGTESLEPREIRGPGQRDKRPAARIGGVGDIVCRVFRHVRDAGILDAPELLGMLGGIWAERRCGVNLPVIDAVARTGDTEVRKSATILHAAEQERRAVGQPGNPWVEYSVDRIRPVRWPEDGVARMPLEEGLVPRVIKSHGNAPMALVLPPEWPSTIKVIRYAVTQVLPSLSPRALAPLRGRLAPRV